jgi:hypothetical protein
MKARTARSVSRSKKENADGSTVVFLKSPYKSEFYKSDGETNVESLTFLEAANYFEAKASEPAFELPNSHYTQVQVALDAFEKDFFGSATETVTTTDKADARSNQARKFLRDIRGITKHDEIKTICTNLSELVDRGTYTQLPNEIKNLKQKLDKKQITYAQVETLLVEFARKFDAIDDVSTPLTDTIANVEPEIVLSETFID